MTLTAPAYISGGHPPSLASLIHIHHSLSHTLAHPFIYKSHMRYLDSYIYISNCISHTHRRRIVAQAGNRGAIGSPPNGAKDCSVNQEGIRSAPRLIHLLMPSLHWVPASEVYVPSHSHTITTAVSLCRSPSMHPCHIPPHHPHPRYRCLSLSLPRSSPY